MSSNSNADDTLSSALEEVRLRIGLLEKERLSLDRMIASAREELRLLLRVASLRRGDVFPDGEDIKIVNDSTVESPELLSENADCANAVVEELTAAARPLHISELMRLLQERGVNIPGAGNQANLISYIRRDQRVVRTSRGVYGLKVWGLEDMPVRPLNRRRIKVRKKSKGVKE